MKSEPPHLVLPPPGSYTDLAIQQASHVLDLTTLSDRQWAQYCDFDLSNPLPLVTADLTRPFVYDRAYGVFYVPGGLHQSAMSFLLALRHQCPSGIDVAKQLGLDYSSGTADYWLETVPGAAFRTSVGDKRIKVATGKGFTPLERRLFADFDALLPSL